MSAPPVVQGKVVGRVDAEQPYPCQAHSADWEVQHSCRDGTLPPEIRLGFVKKVYGILGLMLLLTFSISLPFIFQRESTLGFFRSHSWLLYLIIGIVFAQIVFDIAMSCQLCCGGSGLLQGYIWMMKTVPWNYLYLTTFSTCLGVMVGFFCAQYEAQSVLLVFALTSILVVALTIYAVRTKADFTGCGAYIMVSMLGLMMVILVFAMFPGSAIFSKVIAGIGATLFGFIIVYDTQQIFGSAAASFGGGKRDFEYTIDMYAFAAWNLYLDFLNFFIYMLQLFGDRQ